MPNVVLGLTMGEWMALFFIAMLISLLPGLWGVTTSLWTTLGLLLTVMVLGHLCFIGDRYVAFPSLIAFAGCLQWIMGAWLSDLFPPNFPLFQMAIPIDDYMRYAVPATAFFWFGLHWPVRKALKSSMGPVQEIAHLQPPLRRMLDGVLIGGLILTSVSEFVGVRFQFVLYILASFRFFAALCWLLTRTPGWKLRVGVIFVHLFFQATEEGIFYQLVHWGGYFVLVYGFREGWRLRLALVLVSAILCLGLLQTVKHEYRMFLGEKGVVSSVERFRKLGGLVEAKVFESRDGKSQDTFGDVLVRFNQGWIVSRIMLRVPKFEPYAHGQTILNAMVFTFVPRALAPQKREGASKLLFAQYTGLQLSRWTSMGLGVIGELYANFGRWGGAIATLVYGSVVGLLFAFFLKLSFRNPFWWALAPLVLLPTVEPGWNIEDISNHVFKSGIAIFVVVWGFLRIRRLLDVRMTSPRKMVDSTQPVPDSHA